MLPYWIEFFEDLQQVRGRTVNTVMAYRRDLELWQEYKQSASSVAGFFEFMRKKKLSERSQARVISSVRTYYRFCEKNGLKAPELVELRPPKVDLRAPKPLTPSDYLKLFRAAEVASPARTLRNQVALMLLYETGMRASELIDLNLDDLRLHESEVRIIGKAGRERQCKLSESSLAMIENYLSQSRDYLRKVETSNFLVNDRGKKPSRIDLWRWLDSWSEKAGFEETIGPHQFRHGCAANLLESGSDLSAIQEQLGHASLQTTQMYAPLMKE